MVVFLKGWKPFSLALIFSLVVPEEYFSSTTSEGSNLLSTNISSSFNSVCLDYAITGYNLIFCVSLYSVLSCFLVNMHTLFCSFPMLPVADYTLRIVDHLMPKQKPEIVIPPLEPLNYKETIYGTDVYVVFCFHTGSAICLLTKLM